jgi:hypothetical protein
VQSPCNPLIEDYIEIFYMIDKWEIPSIQYTMSFTGLNYMRKVDGLILIFIDFYVLKLTLCFNSNETSLQLSENIYRRHQQRNLDRHQVFGAYLLYILYNVEDRREPCDTPDCIFLGVGISTSTEALTFLRQKEANRFD